MTTSAAQLRAIKKYRQTHREQVNEYTRKQMKERYIPIMPLKREWKLFLAIRVN